MITLFTFLLGETFVISFYFSTFICCQQNVSSAFKSASLLNLSSWANYVLASLLYLKGVTLVTDFYLLMSQLVLSNKDTSGYCKKIER